MMSRALWTELKPKWPAGFWDDWLREPEQRRGRSCIRPEMNRVFTFGAEGGASGGQFYHEYLATIQLNTVAVDWQHKADLVSQLTKVRDADILVPFLSPVFQLLVEMHSRVCDNCSLNTTLTPN
jgi:hypothetical protein